MSLNLTDEILGFFKKDRLQKYNEPIQIDYNKYVDMIKEYNNYLISSGKLSEKHKLIEKPANEAVFYKSLSDDKVLASVIKNYNKMLEKRALKNVYKEVTTKDGKTIQILFKPTNTNETVNEKIAQINGGSIDKNGNIIPSKIKDLEPVYSAIKD